MSALAFAVLMMFGAGGFLVARWTTYGRGRITMAIGVIVVATGGWLFTQTVERPLQVMLAVVVGLGIGTAICRVGLRLGQAAPSEPSRPRASTVVIVLAIVATLLVGGWIGANSPRERWLGPIVSHGNRHGNLVALTFDDGPNVHETLKVAHLLDAFGAKGTFFTVGKALDARPDISRALLADGQLLGNHSYHHDEWRWLDPRYPELERTQAVFRKRLDVCPTFYRPPHGQHTPFMAYALARKHMTMVGWDTSAADWATTDGHVVARRILQRVRPGSIIVLHDGLDGNLTANRSVLTVAIPIILRGLRARGLQSVTLARLLGTSGYSNSHC